MTASEHANSGNVKSGAGPARAPRFDHPAFRVLRKLGLFHPLLRTYRRFTDYRRRRRALAGRGLVPEAALKSSLRNAIERLRRAEPGVPLGDYLEFGVCYGSSLACMHDALVETGAREVRLFGFDSFEGMPAEAEADDNRHWTAGQLKSTLSFTRKLLKRRGVEPGRTHLIKGWFEDTATPELIRTHGIERASIIMVDCVIYSSTRTVLRFCEPLIKGPAIIIFDDWNAYGLADDGMGERRAFEEFLAEHPDIEVVERLPTYDKLAAVFLVHRPAQAPAR